MTRTFVRYFNEDDLSTISAEVVRLMADWNGRAPHVPLAIREAGNRRILGLQVAVEMLMEPVAE